MFVMIRRRASLVALLLLLISRNACANERPERSNTSRSPSYDRHKNTNTEAAELWKKVNVANINDSMSSETNVAGTLLEKVDGTPQEMVPTISSPRVEADADHKLQLRRRKTPTQVEAAQITAPPLLPRQDQAQVDQLNARIQSLQQSAQQALQALSDASRAVSQASQQLSQSSQQLSQSSSRLSGSSQQLSLQLSVATQSVQSLTGALSSVISSGNSAFASCTSSASNVLAMASGDAQTRVAQAFAQATVARNEADREAIQAQSSAVSITKAAAIIVGSSAGSSLLTIIIVLLILRHRRKKRRERKAQAEAGGSWRPSSPASYNSMALASATTRDVKEPIPPAQTTGSTAVAPPARFQSVRIVDVSRNASSSSSKTSNTAAAAVRSKPDSFLGEGSVDAGGSEGMGNVKTPTYSVFPKVDPDARGKQQSPAQPQPPSAAAPTLQTWLRTANVSPYGPLDSAAPSDPATQPVAGGKADRASEVKWPLQDARAGGGNLGRSATDTSSRYSRQGFEEDGDVEEKPAEAAAVVVVRENPDTRSPVVVGARRGPGLPGRVRKVLPAVAW